MLLQNFIQFLSLLVVKVEVLALRHGFRSHHFGDSGPIPTILEEAWNTETRLGHESHKREPPFFISVPTVMVLPPHFPLPSVRSMFTLASFNQKLIMEHFHILYHLSLFPDNISLRIIARLDASGRNPSWTTEEQWWW